MSCRPDGYVGVVAKLTEEEKQRRKDQREQDRKVARDAYIKKMVDAMPPLSPEQRDQIARMLRPPAPVVPVKRRSVPPVNPGLLVRLTPDDAGDTAQFLLGLAALIDPDDPDGLPGVPDDQREALLLTSAQVRELHKIARYREAERGSLAAELRRLSATISGQIR